MALPPRSLALTPTRRSPTIPSMRQEPERQFMEVAPVYDDLMAVVPYPQWADYVELLWQRFGARPGTLLDLACGTGNVFLEFRKRGYQVAGADYSPAMLREARRKAGPEVPLYCQDMTQLELDRTFDACVCLFDSLNYLLEEAELRAAFAGVYRHLGPGGTFVFDMNSLRALETGMFNQEGHGRSALLHYLWRSDYDPVTRRCAIAMEYRLHTPEGVRLFHETHVQRGYTLEEISAGLAAAGFEVLGCFDSFTLREPVGRSDRYHVAARRPR